MKRESGWVGVDRDVDVQFESVLGFVGGDITAGEEDFGSKLHRSL